MTSYHVTLGGQGLILDLDTYEKRPAATFAAKQSSGDRDYSDQLVEQAWAQSDWSGADGLIDWDPAQPSRYEAVVGCDGYSSPGKLKVGFGLISDYASTNNGMYVFCSYKGKLYAGSSDGKIYELTLPSTWALARDLAKAAGITAMAVYRGKLWIANGTDNTVASFDGTTWTNTAFTGTGLTTIVSMYVFEAGTPLLYCAGPGATNGEIHRWNNSTFSALLYNYDEASAGGLCQLGYDLYSWGLDTAGSRARLVRYNGTTWQATAAEVADNYPLVATYFEGKVYYGMALRGEVWSWDGSVLELVAEEGTDPIRGLAVWTGGLWIGGRSGTQIRLRRHKPETGTTTPILSPNNTVTGSSGDARGLVAFNGDLYAGGVKAAAAPVVKATSTVFGTTIARNLTSSLFTAGLPSIDKILRSVTLVHEALETGESIAVSYELEDSGTFVTLGTSSTIGATTATFSFTGTVTAKIVALRVTLVATSATTPALQEVLLRYVLAPDLKRRWQFEALFEGTDDLPLITLDQAASPDTGAEISAAVWALKDTDGTLAFVDLDGASRSVWFTDLREKVAGRSQRRGSSTRGEIVLVEA